MTAEGHRCRFRAVAFMVDGGAQTLRAEQVKGRLTVFREGVCDFLDRQIAAGHADVLRECLFGVVVDGDRAHRRVAFGDFRVGAADRVFRDDQDTGAFIGGHPCCYTSGPAGANDNHVVVAPFGLDCHRVSPPYSLWTKMARRRRTIKGSAFVPRRSTSSG